MDWVKTNHVKQALREGRPTAGSWLHLCSAISAEIMSRAGFDWLLIDMEHGHGDYQTLLAQLQAIEAAVRAAKYPPMGIRGIAGSHRAGGYGRHAQEYWKRANHEVLVVIPGPRALHARLPVPDPVLGHDVAHAGDPGDPRPLPSGGPFVTEGGPTCPRGRRARPRKGVRR